MALGLLLLLGALMVIAMPRGGPVDGEERIADLFRDGEVPFRLELVESVKLPNKEVVLRLTRDAEGAEEDGALPIEVIFVEYPSAGSVTQVFGGGDEDEDESEDGNAGASQAMLAWEKEPFAWHTTMERDEIVWGEWRTDMAIERAFDEDGSWRDSARVNLSQAGRNLVLFAQWPAKTPVSKDKLKVLLRSIAMQEVEDGA